MLVSVIVPNFNHRRFLPERLDSILNQTYQNFELILLDDCSSDESWDYLSDFENHPKVAFCCKNQINSGSPFSQWKKGLELAIGDLIWIAESDDFSDPSFLEICVSYFESDEVGVVISSSEFIDHNSLILYSQNNQNGIGSYSGNEFVKKFMYFSNSVINASSVVFRKKQLNDQILKEIIHYQLSGDHLFWVGIMKECIVVTLEKKLNFFRWHEGSVRFRELNKLTELIEGIRIKIFLEKKFNISNYDKRKGRKEAYLKYFKFLKRHNEEKKINEFFFLLSFFLPFDKLKAIIRFLI